MSLLKVLTGVAVALALYIIFTWWRETEGISRISNQYHVLGCYASQNINDYPSEIKRDLEKLNSYEDKLSHIDLRDLEWLDKLLPQLSNKLEAFEKSYYELKTDSAKNQRVQENLDNAIRQHEQCLSLVGSGNREDCERVKNSETDIKQKISGIMKDINDLDFQKSRLELEFKKKQQSIPSGNTLNVMISPKDNELAKRRQILVLTRNETRDLYAQRNQVQQRIRANQQRIDKCAASHQLVQICNQITKTLEQFVDEEYHVKSIQDRIEIKTRQFAVLKQAIESGGSNFVDAKREVETCRSELVQLMRMQAQLKEKEALCKEICTQAQTNSLMDRRLQFQREKASIQKKIDDNSALVLELQRQIKDLQDQKFVIEQAYNAKTKDTDTFSDITAQISHVYNQINTKHAKVHEQFDQLKASDAKFGDHAKNIEILNSCAVLRQVAEKLASQVNQQFRSTTGSKTILSRTELARILDGIKM